MLGVVMNMLTIAGYLVVVDMILRMLLERSAAARVAKEMNL